MADHKPKFGNMSDERHIALLALIGVARLAHLRDDLRRIDVERVSRAIILAQQAAKEAAVHPLQPRQSVTFFRAHATQPVADGVAARHFFELKQSAQPGVLAQDAQILQRPTAAREHQNLRYNMNRRGVSRRAAGTGQFVVDQAGNAHRPQIFAKQRQSAMRGQ